jgi:hypothetical protein
MEERASRAGLTLDQCAIRIELGSALAGHLDLLIEAAEGLLGRLTRETGRDFPTISFLVAPWLRACEYRILYGDKDELLGRVYPGRLLATGDPGRLRGLPGRRDYDPVSGQMGLWIPRGEGAVARAVGLPVTDPWEVFSGHLEQALRQHYSHLLALDYARERLREVQSTHPSLVHRASRRIGEANLLEVLRRLAVEGVSLADLSPVLEKLAGLSPRLADLASCTERMRGDLKEAVCRPLSRQGKLSCITLDREYQGWLARWMVRSPIQRARDPWIRHLVEALRESSQRLQRAGEIPVLLCIPSLRAGLGRLLSLPLPELRVLKTDELDPALQVLDRVRIRVPSWLMQASRVVGSLLMPSAARRKLAAELEEYQACLRRRSLPPRPGLAESLRPPPARRPALPESSRRALLSPREKAAILLLECPTWLLREVLSRLSPAEVSLLSREMSRLGLRSPQQREQVLRELPGRGRVQPTAEEILALLRRLLEETPAPETALSELALCLSLLGSRPYHEVSSRLFAWLSLGAAENLRAELVGLRHSVAPARAGRAVGRFLRFYREGVYPLSLYGRDLLFKDLQRVARRNPRLLALCLERLWLRGEAQAETFVRWTEACPSRAAHWLLRWAVSWKPGPEEPEEQARTALRALPEELAGQVRNFLAPELRHLVQTGPSSDPEGPVRQWLAEYYLRAYPDSPAAELSLN